MQWYQQFIGKFDSRINPVKLTVLANIIGSALNDPIKAIEFFKSLLASQVKLGTEATICLDMDIVRMKIILGELNEAKILLETAKSQLNTISPTVSVVFAKFYKAYSEYLKVML